MNFLARVMVTAALLMTAGCDGRTVDSGDGAAPAEDTKKLEGGTGGCLKGVNTRIGKLCIRGVSGKSDEQISAGKPVLIQLFPHGCFSSSCTKKHLTHCRVKTASRNLEVSGQFCLENTSGGGACSADCSGGGWADCSSTVLQAGQYKATFDKLTVDFTVPGRVPFGGKCAGQQF